MEYEGIQDDVEKTVGLNPIILSKTWQQYEDEKKPITIGKIYLVDTEDAVVYVGMEFNEKHIKEDAMMDLYETVQKVIEGVENALFEKLYASKKDLVTVTLTPGQKTLVFTFHDEFPKIKTNNFLN